MKRQFIVPQGTFESGEIFGTVVRCGCGDPNSHSLRNLPCSRPRAFELAGSQGLIGRVEAKDFHAYTFERDPTLTELLGDFLRACRDYFKAVLI